jgi:hypothetical protein
MDEASPAVPAAAVPAPVARASALVDPWSEPERSPTTFRSIPLKRRRRAFHAAEPEELGGVDDVRGVEDAPKRRVMKPAIPSMSVRDERKALQEIRAMEQPSVNDRLTSVDMTVSEFALRFVKGHHIKRMEKGCNNRVKCATQD